LIDKVACGRIRHPANGCHVSHLAVTRLVSPLGNARIRDGSSRVDAVPKGISQPHLASFPTAHQCRRAGIGVGRQRDAPRRIATFDHATLRVATHRYATLEPLGKPGGSRAFSADGPPQAPVAPRRLLQPAGGRSRGDLTRARASPAPPVRAGGPYFGGCKSP
jgi:hypothetical protein